MELEKMENRERRDHGQKPGALFIPGGILLGMGAGFLVNNVAVGLFIGLGLGFIAFGIQCL